MKSLHIRWSLLTAPILLVFAAISLGASEPGVRESDEQTDPGTPICITSDSVKSDHNMRWVEFIGNARATQQDAVITADRIKIFYRPGGDTGEVTSSIEKIISEGNVKIVFDNNTKTATAQKAVYTADERVLVLSEGDPTVWSGKNKIRGKRITLFENENRTLVEGNENEQVEATFYTDSEGGLIK